VLFAVSADSGGQIVNGEGAEGGGEADGGGSSGYRRLNIRLGWKRSVIALQICRRRKRFDE